MTTHHLLLLLVLLPAALVSACTFDARPGTSLMVSVTTELTIPAASSLACTEICKLLWTANDEPACEDVVFISYGGCKIKFRTRQFPDHDFLPLLSLQECKDECLDRDDCNSVNYEEQASFCYINYGETAATDYIYETDNNVDLYTKICSNSVDSTRSLGDHVPFV